MGDTYLHIHIETYFKKLAYVIVGTGESDDLEGRPAVWKLWLEFLGCSLEK